MKRSISWMALALASMAWGCGEAPPAASSGTEEVQVKGIVKVKGKEFLKGKIQFETANINRPDAPTFTFDIQDDGSYTGTTLIGENNVTLVTPPKSKVSLPPFRKEVVLTSGENVIDIDVE